MAGKIKLSAPSGGSVTLDAADTATNFSMTVPAVNGIVITADSTTGAAQFPSGTTAQRPVSPSIGQFRYNSTISSLEIYTGSVWTDFISGYLASYVAVAGGGGGNSGANGQGGGAGGALFNTVVLSKGLTYSVTIGGGGPGAPTGGTGTNGNNTVFGGFATCVGGGANGNAAQGTAGQGYNKGSDASNSRGGGGGTAQAGYNAVDNTSSGNGGGGIYNNITGTFAYYGGGGGTGGRNQDIGIGAGSGGAGGGGAGSQSGAGTAATVNTGGGGGGGGYFSSTLWGGGNGGSGVVFISVPTTKYTGTTTGSPTVTTNGAYTVMKFTASGTYTA